MSYFIKLGKEIEIKTTTATINSVNWRFWGLEVPFLGYVEAHLKIPEIEAFDIDVLLLIMPDCAHTQHTLPH